MKFTDILFEDNTIEKYPVIVLDDSLTVDYYNELTIKIVPDIEKDKNLNEFVEISELRTALNSQAPIPITVVSKTGAYLAAFFKATRDYNTFYVIVLVPELNSSAVAYMSSKLTVLRKCESVIRMKRSRETDCSDDITGQLQVLSVKSEQCKKIVQMTNKDFDGHSDIELEEMLRIIFDYYQSVRFNDGISHYKLYCNNITVRITSLLATVMTGMFHFAVRASINSRAEVRAEQKDNRVCVSVLYSPTRKTELKTGFPDDTELYRIYGFDAADIIYIRRLAEANGWNWSLNQENNRFMVMSLDFSQDEDNSTVCNTPYMDMIVSYLKNIVDAVVD